MMILSMVGLIVLVAVVAVGGYWLVNNVSFKQDKDKDDAN